MFAVAKIVLIAYFLSFPIFAAFGEGFFLENQRPRFNSITQSDGLPNNSVSSIFQDRRGLMWFGTQSGLVQYDGHSFRTFRNEPFVTSSLPHDLVQTSYYDDATDTIWVGTYAGLARYRDGSSDFESFIHDPEREDSLSGNVVIAISRGPDGDLWVGTQSGLNRMREDGSFELIPTRHNVIRDLFLDAQGTLWVGSLAGLSRWDQEAQELAPIEDLEAANVMAIDEIESGVLVLGTWEVEGYDGGVVVFSEKHGELRRHQFSTNTIYTVLAASDGSLWAGSWGGGLFAVDRSGETHEFTPETEPNLSDPVIYSFHEDRSGVIWVGTNGGGLHFLSPRQGNFRAHYHDSERAGSLPRGRVTELFRDSRGTLWAGTYGGGLGRLDPGSDEWQVYRAESESGSAGTPRLADNIVNSITEDIDGSVWVGTNGGLQRFRRDPDRFEDWDEVFPEHPLTDKIIYAVTRDREGRYWIGTYQSGITRYDPYSEEAVRFCAAAGCPHSIGADLIYAIEELSDGRIWVATNGGVSRYEPETESFTTFRYSSDNRQGLSNNTVRAILEDPESPERVWFATLGGGINRFDADTETFTHITAADGLVSNKIVSLLAGRDGRIWAGTQEGLAAYDPSSGMIRTIDERDGLFGNEFNAGALREPDGTLLFGGSHGITRIDSSRANRNTAPPPVQITDVRVFQHSIAEGRLSFNDASVELGPSDTFVEFEFAALDFEAPNRNTYRYRLVGFDDDWVDVGARNFTSYTNLPAGEYRLEVLAANAHGVWSETPATLALRVVAPWYARWWAIILYVVASVLVVYSIVRARDARILADKNKELNHAVSQLAVANEELERLSVRDALTDCFNRRYFDETLKTEWNRARRAETPLGLLMVDIDRFKDFNDIYGHVQGDRVLARVAAAMRAQVNRSTDFVARYGGEEFVVVLYQTDREGALSVGEGIRRAVENAELGVNGVGVTVSVGVAGVIPSDEHAVSLVQAADAALYAAKRAGRNCVVVDNFEGNYAQQPPVSN